MDLQKFYRALHEPTLSVKPAGLPQISATIPLGTQAVGAWSAGAPGKAVTGTRGADMFREVFGEQKLDHVLHASLAAIRNTAPDAGLA
jgi:hypothetical protein